MVAFMRPMGNRTSSRYWDKATLKTNREPAYR
jgi:hypothetical protein